MEIILEFGEGDALPNITASTIESARLTPVDKLGLAVLFIAIAAYALYQINISKDGKTTKIRTSDL